MVKSSMASPNTETDQGFKYKGVRKRKWGKWVSEIRLPNSRERIWLGSYDSAEKAARAFDAALFCLRGGHANFNFPDTPFHFHLPPDLHNQSLTPHQIQLLAATFAKQPHPDSPHKESSGESYSNTVTLTETASSTCTSSTSLQLDHGDASSIDWSFLNLLDSNELVASDYGLYSELDNFPFGEFGLSLTSPAVPFDHSAQENQTEDAFSHHSFLWNFGY